MTDTSKNEKVNGSLLKKIYRITALADGHTYTYETPVRKSRHIPPHIPKRRNVVIVSRVLVMWLLNGTYAEFRLFNVVKPSLALLHTDSNGANRRDIMVKAAKNINSRPKGVEWRNVYSTFFEFPDAEPVVSNYIRNHAGKCFASSNQYVFLGLSYKYKTPPDQDEKAIT